jgi:hypothetical protein
MHLTKYEQCSCKITPLLVTTSNITKGFSSSITYGYYQSIDYLNNTAPLSQPIIEVTYLRLEVKNPQAIVLSTGNGGYSEAG